MDGAFLDGDALSSDAAAFGISRTEARGSDPMPSTDDDTASTASKFIAHQYASPCMQRAATVVLKTHTEDPPEDPRNRGAGLPLSVWIDV